MSASSNSAFPVRLLDKSLFLTSQFPDVWAAARMGWRAPLFLFKTQVDGPVANGTPRSFVVTDGTGHVHGERVLPFRADWGDWEGYCDFGELVRPMMKKVLAGRTEEAQKRAFFVICRHMDALTEGTDSAWQDFLTELERNRFEVGAWFERDRRHLSLTDTITGDTLIDLWDDEVDEAIEDGFLAVPRGPKPAEADWLAPMLRYAEQYDAIPSLRAPPPDPDRPRSRP